MKRVETDKVAEPKPKDSPRERVIKAMIKIRVQGIMYALTGWRPEKGLKSLILRMDWVLRDYKPDKFRKSDFTDMEWFKIQMIYRMVKDTKEKLQSKDLTADDVSEILTLPYAPKRKTIWKNIKKFLKPYKKGEIPT